MSNDDLSVFDDSPNVGLGPDGQYHNDPYCAAIAPMGTPEAQHGEVCGYCEKRREAALCKCQCGFCAPGPDALDYNAHLAADCHVGKEAAEAYFDARFDARLEAAARMDRAFWGLDR